MKKTVLLSTLCLFLLQLALSAKAEHVSVTPGLYDKKEFVPWDKFDFVKFTGKIKAYDFSDFLKIIKKKNMSDRLAFLVTEDSSSHIIPVDSLFDANSKFMRSLSTTKVEKVNQLLLKSAIFNHPEIYSSSVDWEDAGFQWGRFLHSRVEISAQHPYHSEVVTPEGYRYPPMSSTVGLLRSFLAIFIIIMLGLIKVSLGEIEKQLGVKDEVAKETNNKKSV